MLVLRGRRGFVTGCRSPLPLSLPPRASGRWCLAVPLRCLRGDPFALRLLPIDSAVPSGCLRGDPFALRLRIILRLIPVGHLDKLKRLRAGRVGSRLLFLL